MRKKHRHAAYHEAGHVVALYRSGLPISIVEIREDGTAITKLGKKVVLRKWYRKLNYVVVLLAGCYAAARGLRISPTTAFLRGGKEDYKRARPLVQDLAQALFKGNEREAWRNAEQSTKSFVKLCWPNIERVAAALLDKGALTADEVETLMADNAHEHSPLPVQAACRSVGRMSRGTKAQTPRAAGTHRRL